MRIAMNFRVCQRSLRAWGSAIGTLCLLAGSLQQGWSEPAEEAAEKASAESSSVVARLGMAPAVLAQAFSSAQADGPSIAKFSARRPAQVRALMLANTRAGQEAAQAASALVPFLPAPTLEIEAAESPATPTAPEASAERAQPETAAVIAPAPAARVETAEARVAPTSAAPMPAAATPPAAMPTVPTNTARRSALAQFGATASAQAASAAPSSSSTAAPAPSPAPQAAPQRTTLGREINALASLDATETTDSGIDAQPRRRAAFQSAMQRAAASSALAQRGAQTSSYQSATSQGRFSPRDSRSGMDPFGEGMQQAAEAISLVPGLAISGAGVFAGYSSNAIPSRGLTSGLGGSLGSDYDYGAMASFSYTNRGRGSDLFINYTPSHTQRVNLEQWSSTNHNLSVSTSKELGARWSLRGVADAGYQGLEQFWLELPILHFPTDIPDTLEGLYDAVEAGRFTDEEFAAILTGAPVVDDPGGRQLDLGRVLSYGGSASASYAYSPRWTYGFSGRLQRSQLRGADRPDRPTVGGFYLADNSSVSGSASMSYRMSPRTSIALNNQTSSSQSGYADSFSNNTMASVSQRLNRSLRYQVGLGIGAVSFSRTLLAATGGQTSATSWTANGGLDYTMGNHVLSLSASRRAGDTFGLGASTTTEGSAGWQWVSARSPWTASASIRVLRLSRAGGETFQAYSLNSDLFSLGLSRRLSPTTYMRTDFYHGRYVSPFDGLFANAQINRLQVSLMWRPAERR